MRWFKACYAASPAKAPGKAFRRRPVRNQMTLADTLAKYMKGKRKVTIAEAAESALAAGYETKSRNFRDIVRQALRKDKRFTRVGRGQFILKG